MPNTVIFLKEEYFPIWAVLKINAALHRWIDTRSQYPPMKSVLLTTLKGTVRRNLRGVEFSTPIGSFFHGQSSPEILNFIHLLSLILHKMSVRYAVGNI